MAHRTSNELVLDADGPPGIQTEEITTKAGQIIREPIVTSTDWRDPDDPGARFRRKGARTISGWKRTWVIDRLRKSSPSEISEQHVRAATRFLDDHEIRNGARCGPRMIERVDGEPGGDSRIVNGQVVAGIRIDSARAAIGEEGYAILFRLIVLNWPVAKVAERLSTSADRAFGRARAGLERLREHYWPVASAPRGAVWEPEEVAMLDGLPVERTGRWRDGAEMRA